MLNYLANRPLAQSPLRFLIRLYEKYARAGRQNTFYERFETLGRVGCHVANHFNTKTTGFIPEVEGVKLCILPPW